MLQIRLFTQPGPIAEVVKYLEKLTMIEIKKQSKNARSWAVFKNGRHVNAFIKTVSSDDWAIWLNDNRFTKEENKMIADRLNELNGIKVGE